jgi:hypothetical protein
MLPYNPESYRFQKNYDLTYASREIFTYLDLFSAIKSFEDIPYRECLMYNPQDFNLKLYTDYFNSADVVIIELSTLRVSEFNGIYYQCNRSAGHPNSPIVTRHQSLQELADDIKLLEKRIGKPVIFFSHINSNFYDIQGLGGYINERTVLEDCMEKYCKNYINLTKLFWGVDYKKVFSTKFGQKDTHHITNDTKKIIWERIKEKIIEIL